ncbi:bifunctional 2-polyprenyl-6-hydroxyphenol methylase/3-demethylubiquinol 3-O-methyltransferase UbiG [Streptomyces sp. FH025]|uniref:class I SAM-dependent methyltransferase n=1 Tax=Streptomyces sp. FH025 TaxID=2815937 RepID=UPI001A9E2A27|nr:class I SAM-dependent methyltransferase [Streptomyces sp. FH025]MBO1419134.1 class I SAM-dependent methyltransferase [Streptomyces sp. FH025]
MKGPEGTAGYGEQAEQLAVQYESVSFAQVHRSLLRRHYPAPPAAVLDVGAGTGRDAAALAALGHRVVAVEPTPELRAVGERLHAGSGVRWVADALPELPVLSAGGERFDLILITAVWMHLAPDEGPPAMDALVRLLAPGGRLALTLRHGPVPPGRRMFDLPPEHTIALATARGLRPIHRGERPDLHGREDVHWTELLLERPG